MQKLRFEYVPCFDEYHGQSDREAYSMGSNTTFINWWEDFCNKNGLFRKTGN